jgi:hypothetical protein
VGVYNSVERASRADVKCQRQQLVKLQMTEPDGTWRRHQGSLVMHCRSPAAPTATNLASWSKLPKSPLLHVNMDRRRRTQLGEPHRPIGSVSDLNLIT